MFAKYRKAVALVAVAVATFLVSALTNNVISADEWLITAGVLVSAVGTYVVPELPEGVAGSAKTIVTFLVTGFAAAVPLIDGGLTVAEVLTILLAAAAAIGLSAVPNVGDYRDRVRSGTVTASGNLG